MIPVDANDFMALLSKVLTTAPANDSDIAKSLRELDGLLRDELPNALNAAGHPDAPALMAKCSAFQDALEMAVQLAQILDKPVVLLEGNTPSRSLAFLKECVKSPIPSICLKTDCDIPILVVHSDAIRMVAMNYSNSLVSLDLKEDYPMLLEGSRQFNIELARMVKYFILHIPLKTRAGTFILAQKDAGCRFNRFIALRFLASRTGRLPKKSEALNEEYAGILCEKQGNDIEQGLKILSAQTFALKMTKPIAIPLYGFLEEFALLTSEIINYFMLYKRYSEKRIEGLTDDIIRVESGFSSSDDDKKTDIAKTKKKSSLDIASLCEKERNLLESKTSNLHQLKHFLVRGKELVNTIITSLEAGITASRFLPADVREDVFKTFFKAVDAGNSEYYNQAIVRLQTLGFADIPLMKKYIKSKNTSRKDTLDVDEVTRQCKRLKSDDWAKAKMLVELTDVENASIGLLEKLMIPLDGYVVTGKELFVRAMIEHDPQKQKTLLMAGLFKGYAPAGQMLMEHISEEDNDAPNTILLLAQHLLPEACLAMGEAELSQFIDKIARKKETKFLPITIDKPCMLYFKLAASQDSSEALARIADVLFDTSFKDVYFIDKRPVSQQKLLVNNAKIICWIANKLIGEHFQTAHFTEISGITLFCLNDKKFFFEARKLLSSLKQRSAEASYCLGYMSEHGLGCAKNFTSAVKYYKKALEDGPFTANGEYVSKRLSAARQKSSKQFKDRIGSYNEDDDYSGSSETSSYSSGGITMVFLVTLGLGYHARALEEFRSFRDSCIKTSTLGKELVDEYYRVGPVIRHKIGHSGNAEEICEKLWLEHIEPIQQSIRDGKRKEATQALIDMQVELCNKYSIPYNEQLVDQFKKLNSTT